MCWDIVRHAVQVRDGRVEVERAYRDEVRRIAVPLRLGDMGETHFVLRDEWQSRFRRKQAEAGALRCPCAACGRGLMSQRPWVCPEISRIWCS